MAHKAKDGTEYTNKMMVNKHNARQENQTPENPPAQGEMQSDSESQSDAADQHVDAMLASGMTPDDIHQHAKKRSGQQAQEPEQQSSALSSIPGM